MPHPSQTGSTGSDARARRLRKLDRALIAAGFALLLCWLAGREGSRLYLAASALRSSRAQASASPEGFAEAADPSGLRPPLPKLEGCIGRITIPRVGISAAILEGTGSKALLLGVGHVEGSAGPGAPGETILAGHRDTVFRPLKDVRKDDLVWIDTEGGSYVYRVLSTRIVQPHPIALAPAEGKRELTLITCYPFHYLGSAPKRYIITAEELGSD